MVGCHFNPLRQGAYLSLVNVARLLPWWLIISLFFFSSCEKEKSVLVNPNFSSPFLVSISSSDSELNLDTSTSGAVSRLPNLQFRISGSINASATDPDGIQDIKEVVYHIYEPRSSDYIASGVLRNNDTNYSGNFSFVINRSDAGTYRIEVYAQDKSDLISNSLEVSLIIKRNNSIPRISNVVAPDTLKRPTSGTALALFSLTVNDSDGYNDIEQAFFKRISPSSSNVILLFDNGDQQGSGDVLTGDGIFSRVVRIDSTALLGNQVFLFQAKDKTGALSDSLTHTITIIP